MAIKKPTEESNERWIIRVLLGVIATLVGGSAFMTKNAGDTAEDATAKVAVLEEKLARIRIETDNNAAYIVKLTELCNQYKIDSIKYSMAINKQITSNSTKISKSLEDDMLKTIQTIDRKQVENYVSELESGVRSPLVIPKNSNTKILPITK